jgi:hypothetical protein
MITAAPDCQIRKSWVSPALLQKKHIADRRTRAPPMHLLPHTDERSQRFHRPSATSKDPESRSQYMGVHDRRLHKRVRRILVVARTPARLAYLESCRSECCLNQDLGLRYAGMPRQIVQL